VATQRGYPAVLRCDNGPELACAAMADWPGDRLLLAFIPPGQPWRNGYIESFNFTIQRELGANFVITTSYVGTRSIRQGLTYFDVNAGLVPGLGNAGRPLNPMGINVARNFFIPMATNRYDAWQTNVTRRFADGLR